MKKFKLDVMESRPLYVRMQLKSIFVCMKGSNKEFLWLLVKMLLDHRQSGIWHSNFVIRNLFQLIHILNDARYRIEPLMVCSKPCWAKKLVSLGILITMDCFVNTKLFRN